MRPRLEFSSSVWPPWTTADIDALENVQIKAVKMISGLSSNEYPDRLNELNLWSLEKRRKMFSFLAQKSLFLIFPFSTFSLSKGLDDGRAATSGGQDKDFIHRWNSNEDILDF